MSKFIGKNKLLRTLKEQMNNFNIKYADIQYSREEIGTSYYQERVVYIDTDNIQYQVRNYCFVLEKNTTLTYEIHEQVSAGHYRIKQRRILKEREDN